MTFQDATADAREQVKSAQSEMRGIRDDVADIAADLRRLLSMEGELARAEADEARGHVTKGGIFGAAAAVTALIGLVFVFLTIMFALDTAMDTWLAALITTLIVFAVAAILGLLARQQMKKFSPVPQRFIRTMKEDMTWARSQIRSSAR